MYGWGDEIQTRAQVKVKNPFVVQATKTDDDPGRLMHDALVRSGHAKPGEKLTPTQITQRLKNAGYDSVEVKQPSFSHEIAGSQLVVFDPKLARLHPGRRKL